MDTHQIARMLSRKQMYELITMFFMKEAVESFPRNRYRRPVADDVLEMAQLLFRQDVEAMQFTLMDAAQMLDDDLKRPKVDEAYVLALSVDEKDAIERSLLRDADRHEEMLECFYAELSATGRKHLSESLSKLHATRSKIAKSTSVR